jgi:colanic acid biosynthesis glycosyl transferase WcaI
MATEHQPVRQSSMEAASDARRKPTVVLLYHYMHPDEVVSGRIFDGLGEGLAARGWNVEGWACNRRYGRERETYPRRSDWNGVRLRRVWRPGFRQNTGWGRILNAIWMVTAWTFRLMFRTDPIDVVIVGSDPVMSIVVAIPSARLKSVPVVHWCFDLFPDAAVADGLISHRALLGRIVEAPLRIAYAACAFVVDIGPCMRQRLAKYLSGKTCAQTIVPWALVEPTGPLAEDGRAKRQLFGRSDVMGLLYSGSFGRAHVCEHLLTLAADLRADEIHFCFSIRGNMRNDLLAAVQAQSLPNVHVSDFAGEDDLEARLAAGDVHLVTLREGWTGTVVPSKFFAALAAGRPVVFEGSMHSAVAQWIQQLRVGWVLTRETLPDVADRLRELSRDRTRLKALQEHCHRVYIEHFSKDRALDSWDRLLRGVIGESHAPSVVRPSAREHQEEPVCTRS